MSLRGDGSYRCDRCGKDVGNGGIRLSVQVSDLDPTFPGSIRLLHFCRDTYEGTTFLPGCDRVVLHANNLKNYEEDRA